MTDLATKPVDPPAQGPGAGEPHVEWAEPEKKKRSATKLWLGIGIPVVAVAAVGTLAVVSTTLTAPGVTVLGTDVGTMTASDAESAIAAGVADSSISVSVEGESATFSGAELGLSVDAARTAQSVKDAYPLWKVGAWNPGVVDAELSVDEAAAGAALEDAFSDLYTEPVDARIEFRDGSYTVIPDEQGVGIDAATLASDIADALGATPSVQALAAGSTILAAGSAPEISVDAAVTTIDATFVAEDAKAVADKLNEAVGGVTFTLDGDEVDAVPADTVASWLDVTVGDEGEVDVQAKVGQIQKYADALPDRVDQKAADADVVVDASGNVTKTITEGHDGYEISSTKGVGDEIAAQLTSLKPAEIALQGEKVAHERTERFRRAVVDKSDGYSYFYETVNGGEEKLVKSVPMALGKAGHDTQNGTFNVYGQLTSQNMGDCDADGNYVPNPDTSFDYCTAHVPFVTYFNGDQGFHGTYWHDNFGPGAYMSHGCVNLREADAEWVYYFLQVGSPVTVQA